MVSAQQIRELGLVIGPLTAVVWLLSGDVSDQRVVLALALLMAIWWMTEAIPLGVTALLPLVVLPLFSSLDFAAVARPYTSNIVFLFMGGFVLGLGLQRWGLHRRLALLMLLRVGTGRRRLIVGFMLVTAMLSMWISNTATAMMLMPIAMSVILTRRDAQLGAPEDERRFALALVLGVAYAASLGGLGTRIGTPPNIIMSGFMASHYGIEIDMLDWMAVGLPLVALLLPLSAWWLLFAVFPSPDDRNSRAGEALAAESVSLGKVSTPEKRAAAVFLAVVFAWVFRQPLVSASGMSGLDDGVIALAGAILLFILPSGADRQRLMDWEHAKVLPWDILLLFGGGLSLAAAISASGADAALEVLFTDLVGLPQWLLMLVLGVVVVFSGELTSNTAAASALMPILAALCSAGGLDPLMVFYVATLCGSCGFMLPVATPPNAIAFATGEVSIRDMVRAGFGLNLLCVALIVAYVLVRGVG